MRAATVVAHWTTVASLSARPPSLANQQLDSATGLKVLANARGTPEPGKERGLSSDKQQKSRPSAKEDMPVGQLEAKIQGAARKGRE
ncbi:hypothetical protein THAOC_14825 [Thalassiosira oceanica]|uniref:Uncharacterized protein n=1 Tax=Thalassiosira oceanica TaxID=159749 RepID=K0SHH8_THAOC|nr:hypothetical protein THAOC_14825 [Thalassiosira oceanica]|eukprot:EJK64439.1 hypothetical protein THAOC_14825 [Thalassiosira oceanica]